MVVIQLVLTHPNAVAPTHHIADRVALICDCEPLEWAIGSVIGMSLQDFQWSYLVQLDHPSGLTEDCGESDLVSVRALPLLQSHWEAQGIPY